MAIEREDIIKALKNLFNQSSKVLILLLVLVGLLGFIFLENISTNKTIIFCAIAAVVLWNRLNSRSKYSISLEYGNSKVCFNTEEKTDGKQVSIESENSPCGL